SPQRNFTPIPEGLQQTCRAFFKSFAHARSAASSPPAAGRFFVQTVNAQKKHDVCKDCRLDCCYSDCLRPLILPKPLYMNMLEARFREWPFGARRAFYDSRRGNVI
ncbi:MAG: hypothetical protein ACRD5L_13725, partial [Bryobacteraceae bacterium]